MGEYLIGIVAKRSITMQQPPYYQLGQNQYHQPYHTQPQTSYPQWAEPPLTPQPPVPPPLMKKAQKGQEAPVHLSSCRSSSSSQVSVTSTGPRSRLPSSRLSRPVPLGSPVRLLPSLFRAGRPPRTVIISLVATRAQTPYR